MELADQRIRYSRPARTVVRASPSFRVHHAAVHELAREAEIRRRASDVTPDRRARLERPLRREFLREARLQRAAVLVLDVDEVALVDVADHEPVEVAIDLEDREQRTEGLAGQ